MNNEYHAETGLRVLLGFVAREAAKYDRGVEPLFCFSREHYCRLHIRLLRGAASADRSCRMMGYVLQCPSCIYRTHEAGILPHQEECPYCGKHLVPIGPLWAGPLQDRDLLARISESIPGSGYRLSAELQKLVDACIGELDIPFHYDYHRVARHFRYSPPPIERVIASLRSRGYAATRAHFSGTAIKTDAPHSALRDALAGYHRD
jgi:tRNA (guanine26-N2/guanine27-N2)-dimethyltransferase